MSIFYYKVNEKNISVKSLNIWLLNKTFLSRIGQGKNYKRSYKISQINDNI